MKAGVASTRRQAVGQSDELDLGALGRALWRHRRWIIGLTLLAAGIAFIAVNLITPRYKSEARVLVETRDPLSETPEERVLKSFAERLSAFQVEKSRVIAIEFESEDPELAAQAANTVAETYLVFQQAAKQDQSRTASQFLAGEIDRLRKEVSDAE